MPADRARYEAPDGTVWVYKAPLGTWTGWRPGHNESWDMTSSEFAANYPAFDANQVDA